MRRRDFTTLLGGAATLLPLASLAQEAKARRIWFPARRTAARGLHQWLPIRTSRTGSCRRQHFVIEFGLAQSAAQIPNVAAELVGREFDIIIAAGTPSVRPATDAAGQIPVVFVATLDPVATGLVASLARPDRNITGMTTISTDLTGKRLQLTRELLPNLTRKSRSCPASTVRIPLNTYRKRRPRHGNWV